MLELHVAVDHEHQPVAQRVGPRVALDQRGELGGGDEARGDVGVSPVLPDDLLRRHLGVVGINHLDLLGDGADSLLHVLHHLLGPETIPHARVVVGHLLDVSKVVVADEAREGVVDPEKRDLIAASTRPHPGHPTSLLVPEEHRKGLRGLHALSRVGAELMITTVLVDIAGGRRGERHFRHAPCEATQEERTKDKEATKCGGCHPGP